MDCTTIVQLNVRIYNFNFFHNFSLLQLPSPRVPIGGKNGRKQNKLLFTKFASEMGIQGLIPFCEQATSPMVIAEIKGKTVAIDSYCYLHRGAYGCSDKIVKNIKTTAHIDYCMKYVNMLLSLNITPIMVFDGR